ncbi:MAG: MFS transporter [Anaerolineae bacterium]|nr:MFS transporter [Anaerolineae bacterium]
MNTITTGQTTTTSNRLRVAVGYFLTFMSLGVVAASLGPALPTLAERTGVGFAQISILLTARSIGYMVGSPLAGRLLDRVKPHAVMIVGLVVMIATMLAVPEIPILWILVAILVLMGIAESAADVGGNTLLSWLYREDVGPFMNALHFCWGIGNVIAPAIMVQAFLLGGDLRWAFIALSVLILPPILWIMFQPAPVNPRPVTVEDSQPINWLPVGLFTAFLLLYVGLEINFGSWIFTYAVERGFADETAGLLNSAYWGAFTVGRLLSIPLASKLRPSQLIQSELVLAAISLAVMTLWQDAPIALWIGTIGLGFSLSAIFPTTISLAERRIGISGKITGIFMAGAGLGGLILPLAIGYGIESVGPQAFIYIMLTILALLLIVYRVVLRVAKTPAE